MKWIGMTERYPQSYDFVIVCEKRRGSSEPSPISIGRWTGKEWEMLGDKIDEDGVLFVSVQSDLFWDIEPTKITHWMPLPEKPHET